MMIFNILISEINCFFNFIRDVKMKYDYLIVGSGLFGSVFAHEMTKKGKKCLVIEKRDHIGGNVYTEEEHGMA